MGRTYDNIEPHLVQFILNQHVFFVGTAPSGSEGHVNISPKGYNTLRVLGPNRVAYADLTGSGIETIAHLRENGRIVLMFCAFVGPPRILRLHGRGSVVEPTDSIFGELSKAVPTPFGLRAIIDVNVERVSDSCGYGVPIMHFQEDRDQLRRWIEKKGDQGLRQYWATENSTSIDGLPGLGTNSPK